MDSYMHSSVLRCMMLNATLKSTPGSHKVSVCCLGTL